MAPCPASALSIGHMDQPLKTHAPKSDFKFDLSMLAKYRNLQKMKQYFIITLALGQHYHQ